MRNTTNESTFLETNSEPFCSTEEGEEELLPLPGKIGFYGADIDAAGLVRRINEGEIYIPQFSPSDETPPAATKEVDGFQREFVWTRPQMSKFIESLLLKFPIPGIFLVKDSDDRMLVLDGQQRLTTLTRFWAGGFALTHIGSNYNNKKFSDLTPQEQRVLKNSIIHCTILTDTSKEAIYSTYERLNTGGSNLKPQEIRTALFPGAFLQGISELNKHKDWRSLYDGGNHLTPKTRLKDHELILRILALYSTHEMYNKPMKKFLNNYLQEFQNSDVYNFGGSEFKEATTLLYKAVGINALRPNRIVNQAFTDSVLVGLMHRLADQSKEQPTVESVKAAYDFLKMNKNMQSWTSYQTSDLPSVQNRINLSRETFQNA
ncbi:DUF262 domain-containing protein [Dermabacteraceae bacterium CCM 9519]